MSRYYREGLSPFAPQDGEGAPRVTDDDFSYITSEDLEHSLQAPARGQQPTNAKIDDDVLLIKNKATIYPVHFPAYSIGDGKLYVRDVRERVGMVMEVGPKQTSRIKMLYKGRQLKDEDLPIRTYNVKNNSEILVVLPEIGDSGDDSDSTEEIVVADSRDGQPRKSKGKSKGKRGKKKSRSPRDSSNLEVPGAGAEGRKSDTEESRQPSRMPSPPQVPSGALDKLQAISSHFNTKLLPLCIEFSASPPKDRKKCEDEHRKLSETVMQQVMLKLDEVDTGGDPDIRAKRKQLVNQVQDVLNGMDRHLPEGSVKPQMY